MLKFFTVFFILFCILLAASIVNLNGRDLLVLGFILVWLLSHKMEKFL